MAEQDYNALQDELAAIEKTAGLYLADAAVDEENVGLPPCSTDFENSDAGDAAYDAANDAYWGEMIAAAKMAAGQRAEAAGQDINALIGRVIY